MPHVTFIHGLANKPKPENLLADWVAALVGTDGDGLDLDAEGVTYQMVYWADVLYDKPSDADQETVEEEVSRDINLDLAVTGALDDEEAAFLRALEERLDEGLVEINQRLAEQDPVAADRAVPLPKALERRLMKSLVRDAHHYLYGATFEPRPGERYDVRQELRGRFVRAVAAGNDRPGPHIVISHSMGTMIAYDCLKHVDDCGSVDALITLGSPLGLSEVQDGFGRDWKKRDAYPGPRLRTDTWVNLYDRLDVVCALDPKLANDFREDGDKKVYDQRIRNVGRWRHAVREYLARDQLRDRMRGLLGI